MKKILVLALLLAGCSNADPVTAIVDAHTNHINEALDYAYNNIEQTKDVIFLENELEVCKTALQDVKQAHDSQIATCEAKTDYWRMATFAALIALAGVIFVAIRNFLKVI